MKKLIFVVALLFSTLAIWGTSEAQKKLDEFMTQTTPEERAAMQTDYMKEHLFLTEQQLPEVSDINLKYARKMQVAYQTETRKFQRLKKLRSVGVEKENNLKKVLDKKQYEIYLANKEAMKEKMKERRKD